jgi:hypothetical protein
MLQFSGVGRWPNTLKYGPAVDSDRHYGNIPGVRFMMEPCDRISRPQESECSQKNDTVYPRHPSLGSPFMQTDLPDLLSSSNGFLQTKLETLETDRLSVFKRMKSTVSSTTNLLSDISSRSPDRTSGRTSFSKRVKERENRRLISHPFIEGSCTPGYSPETCTRDLTRHYYLGNSEYGSTSSDSGTFVESASRPGTIGRITDDPVTVRFPLISPASDHEDKGKAIARSYPDVRA